MKRTSRHLICIISAFLLSCSLFGQGTADKDDVLNQYELACRECLELKKRVEAGEKVARKEATERLDLFVALNSRIKSESLTSGQLTRFEAINLWFSSGVRPLVLDHESLPRIILCTTDIPRIHETDSLADFRSSYIPAEKSVKNRFIFGNVTGNGNIVSACNDLAADPHGDYFLSAAAEHINGSYGFGFLKALCKKNVDHSVFVLSFCFI